MEAGCTREAVDMYNQAGMWEQAHKVRLMFVDVKGRGDEIILRSA